MRRRQFLTGSLGATLMAAAPSRPGWGTEESLPHYFLQLHYSGGLDPAYLFDARPFSFRDAGLAHCYLSEPPVLWQGESGVSAWVSSLAASLGPLRSEFSVINGVHMATETDGHVQNVNALFTGDVRGGTPFLVELGRRAGAPVDLAELGRLAADFHANPGHALLSAPAMSTLIPTARDSSARSEKAMRWIQQRAARRGRGGGGQSAGARAMERGLAQVPATAAGFAAMEPAAEQPHIFAARLHYALELLRQNVAGAVLLPDPLGPVQLDIHDAPAAKTMPALMSELVGQIALLIRTLRDTPVVHELSMADVTTWAITTEFSRTLRQPGRPVDNTGTDHNAFSNTVILGGRGVRGGQLIGATDLDELAPDTSTFAGVPAAHHSRDPGLLKPIGKPLAEQTLIPAPGAREVTFDDVVDLLRACFGVLPSSSAFLAPLLT